MCWLQQLLRALFTPPAPWDPEFMASLKCADCGRMTIEEQDFVQFRTVTICRECVQRAFSGGGRELLRKPNNGLKRSAAEITVRADPEVSLPVREASVKKARRPSSRGCSQCEGSVLIVCPKCPFTEWDESSASDDSCDSESKEEEKAEKKTSGMVDQDFLLCSVGVPG